MLPVVATKYFQLASVQVRHIIFNTYLLYNEPVKQVYRYRYLNIMGSTGTNIIYITN